LDPHAPPVGSFGTIGTARSHLEGRESGACRRAGVVVVVFPQGDAGGRDVQTFPRNIDGEGAIF
jgi:hypothetical protein